MDSHPVYDLVAEALATDHCGKAPMSRALGSTFSENGSSIALGMGSLLAHAASPGVSSVTSAPKVLQATD